jgi:hypothetical protein
MTVWDAFSALVDGLATATYALLAPAFSALLGAVVRVRRAGALAARRAIADQRGIVSGGFYGAPMTGLEADTLAAQAAAARRAGVRNWARGVLADPWAVALDTETTDLYGAVVEVAVTRRDGLVFAARVKPPVPISDEATAVHGITDEEVARCPPFAAVWPALRPALEGRLIVAYNAAYDRDVLAGELHRMHTAAEPCHGRVLVQGLHPAAAAWIDRQRFACAMKQLAQWNGIPSSSPERKWRNVPLPGGDHSAVGDCAAVWRLLEQLADG